MTTEESPAGDGKVLCKQIAAMQPTVKDKAERAQSVLGRFNL
jgi:hypothetical protein